MSKHLCVVSCPIDTFSGYGSRSRDFVKSLIELYDNEWDIKIIPQRWGGTCWGYIDKNPEWKFLNNYILKIPQIPKQPEVWIQITVPNEFQPMGKFNIGVTAGIETTICDASWIEGMNRMNLNLVSSQHSKTVFESTRYQKMNQQNQPIGELQLTSPCEVLFEGIDLNLFKPQLSNISVSMIEKIRDEVEEDFAFLFVGHWLQGDLGQDRKDVGMLVKVFSEVFKNKKNKPALILKTSGATSSIMDREEILKKLDLIRKTCKGDLPNIYLLHGELEDKHMCDLYNHPKVKAMVSFTKGEGFGRPLLEFSLIQKPLLVPEWSGPLDFLSPEFTTFIPGQLTKLHPSSVVQNMLLPESQWFTIDYSLAGGFLKDMFENYKNYLDKAKRQAYYSKTNFSLDKMKEKLGEILKSKLPEFPKEVKLKLPTLKKIELPKTTANPVVQEIKSIEHKNLESPVEPNKIKVI